MTDRLRTRHLRLVHAPPSADPDEGIPGLRTAGTSHPPRADFEVRWDAGVRAYVASAPDHPHLLWTDTDPAEAVRGLCALVVEATAP